VKDAPTHDLKHLTSFWIFVQAWLHPAEPKIEFSLYRVQYIWHNPIDTYFFLKCGNFLLYDTTRIAFVIKLILHKYFIIVAVTNFEISCKKK
jgi:hypothetical protein